MKPWVVAALVVAGLVLGLIKPDLSGGVFAFVTLYVLLPALIFDAAWQLDAAAARFAWRPILLLAVPGVAITAGIVAIAAHVFGALAIPAALLLGAILSATDPVAVVAIFRRLNLPTGLAAIVESESLLNDGVAVLLYRAMLVGAAAGFSAGSIGAVAIGAILGAVMGVVCGVVVGVAASVALRWQAIPIRVAATLIGAYAAYALASVFDWSGIFAVIACAVVMRAAYRRAGDEGAGEDAAWNVLATAANAILFLGIGAAVQLASFERNWPVVLSVLGAVVLARVVLAYGLRLAVPHLSHAWSVAIGVAGLRGALALALALGLPIDLVGRHTIIDATFGVVVVTLLIGSLTGRLATTALS